MRSIAAVLMTMMILLVDGALVSAGAGGEATGGIEGRRMTVSVSRAGSEGRVRPGSTRWEGCVFWAPLTEAEAERQMAGRTGQPGIDFFVDSDDPNAEFLIFDCPNAPDEIFWQFGGWELTQRPPINVAGRLADHAMDSVWIPEMIPQSSPEGTAAVPLLVNMETWLWVENWTDQSATAWLDAFPADWVTVTLSPVEIVYDPGDGSISISCDPGTEWSNGLRESDCIATYELLPEAGIYTVGAEVYYEAIVTCPANWCNSAVIEVRLNSQLAANPFQSNRDVVVEQSRGLVTG